MAASTYKEALSAVLKHEGGYVNHPADPGGAIWRAQQQRKAAQVADALGYAVAA